VTPQPERDQPTPKSATPERIAANFDVFGFSFTNEELGRIDALSTTRRW
jgi:diketogulonate reductase-like aldo/keto reductase